MTPEKIKTVKEEQQRLFIAIAVLEKAQYADKKRIAACKERGDIHVYSRHFPALTGAIRRASMDLTRALADLRRPA